MHLCNEIWCKMEGLVAPKRYGLQRPWVKIVSLDILCPPEIIVKPDHQTHSEPAEGRRLFNETPMRKQ